MNHSDEVSKVSMYKNQGCWVILVQQELTKESAQRLQRDILDRIHLISVKGVVIDLSGINVIDSQLWGVFLKTSHMVKIMGVPSVITGLNPGAVASIIDLDLNIDEVSTALNLEEALSILDQPAEIVTEDIQDNELLDDTSENDLNNDELIRE